MSKVDRIFFVLCIAKIVALCYNHKNTIYMEYMEGKYV